MKGRITDGEVLASKVELHFFLFKTLQYHNSSQGVGKVRIEPFPGHIVDVFVTHTCASDDNSEYRQKQVNCFS